MTQPLRILILGGTRFIGRHLANAAVAEGHSVALHHRGVSSSQTPDGTENIFGDRDGTLDELNGQSWDVTFDLSGYVPSQVSGLIDTLGDRLGHYVFVSSSAVYDVPQRYGFTEDDPIVETNSLVDEVVTDETYGPLKAACEKVILDRLPDSTIARPTYVVGPDDYSGRFTYWIHRAQRGGKILAPGPADELFQWIDVQDLAPWLLRLGSSRMSGVFTAAHTFPPTPWGEVLQTILSEVAPSGSELVWVEREFMLERDLSADSLPMWPGGNPEGVLEAADPSKAVGAGLQPRTLAETVRQLASSAGSADGQPTTPVGSNDPNVVGLTSHQEQEILREWSGRQ